MTLLGAWHQLGSNTHDLAQALLQNNIGDGAILSPKDLDYRLARGSAQGFKNLGKGILWDPQFYDPEHRPKKSLTYPTFEARRSEEELIDLSERGRDALSKALEQINRDLHCSAVIAPALTYQAGSSKIRAVNRMLFTCAKKAGDAIGIPTLASVPFGNSTCFDDSEINAVLNAATALPADGWYVVFEFSGEHFPRKKPEVLRCATACLSLAAARPPLIFGYAGLLSLPVMAWGAAGAGICHQKTMWQFLTRRFQNEDTDQAEARSKGGGGKKQIPHFFSDSLWQRLVYTAEVESVLQLPDTLHSKILAPTTYSPTLQADQPIPFWALQESHKHLLACWARAITDLANIPSLSQRSKEVTRKLDEQLALWEDITPYGFSFKSSFKAKHLSMWRDVSADLSDRRQIDFDWAELQRTIGD